MSTRRELRQAARASQVRRPWRATLRTALPALVARAARPPAHVHAPGLAEPAPVVAGILAATAAITRVMALPGVEQFLARFAPWLAADPDDSDTT